LTFENVNAGRQKEYEKFWLTVWPKVLVFYLFFILLTFILEDVMLIY